MDKAHYTPLSQGEENVLENQMDESFAMSRNQAPYPSRQSDSSFSDDEDVLKHPIEPLEEEEDDFEALSTRKQVGSVTYIGFGCLLNTVTSGQLL